MKYIITFLLLNIVHSQFNEKSELLYTVRRNYNAQNLLIKEIKTFKQGHEYDLITEYDYDSEGRKINKLSGNNRTGKWYSEGYDYNENGDLSTIYFYQKNGDLTKKRVFEYVYNSEGKKTKSTQIDIDLEMDEETNRSVSLYEYNGENFDIKTIEKDQNGQIIFTEWRTNNLNNQLKIVEYQLPDFPKSKTIYSYNKNGKCFKKVEYETAKIIRTTTYKYNSKGKIVEEKYKTNNGYGGKIYVY